MNKFQEQKAKTKREEVTKGRKRTLALPNFKLITKKIVLVSLLLVLLLALLAACNEESKSSSFSFIYMGDSQANPETGDYSEWGNLLRMAAEDKSKPEFVMIAGDLVNDGNDPAEWDLFFEAGEDVFKQLPLYPAMGNHDNSELFKELFDLPENGPLGKEKAFYSFDYGDAHFLVLDSNTMGAANLEDIAWVEKDLEKTDKNYIIVMFHHPAYPAIDIPKDQQRANTIQENFVPIFEEYGVDLVLSGHQHVHMRTHPLRNGQARDDGIVYLISASGGKQYTPGLHDYTAFALGDQPVYTICTVNEEGIFLETWNSQGILVDSYNIGEKENNISISLERQEDLLSVIDKESGEKWSFTLEQLSQLPNMAFSHIYSTVNNWPSPSFYAAKGMKIRSILEEVDVYDDVQTLTFRSADGYEVSFTRDQILDISRWYYPFVEEGITREAQPVEPIIAYSYKEGSQDIEEALAEPLCLILGQSNPLEHTNPAFVENISEIIYSSEEPEIWEPASTFPIEGYIAAGETVKLQHPFYGLVKLHYTLDGSEPTEHSPMYNPSTYQLEKNKPILITKDTIIKTLVVGYGKENSSVATFKFTVR